uniref:Uncharacterized protein n=1 Tax=Sus scrofa TaxID=9823 RepID=A0A8D0MXE1_PIG
MINGIISLLCFYHLLLVYRNSRVFCLLILYPAPLSDLLMNSSGFLAASLGFSMYTLMSSANRDSFTSFLIWIPFISFSSLITIARTSKTMLNKSDECGHSCLIHDHSRNAFSFSQSNFVEFCQSFLHLLR